MLRRFAGLVVLSLLSGAGCTLDLEGARCDCAEGYVCCEADRICYRPDQVCGASGGSGASSGGSGGARATGGTRTATGGAAVSGGQASGGEANGGEPTGGRDASGGTDGGEDGGQAGSSATTGGITSTGGAGEGGAPDVQGGSANGGLGGSASGGLGGTNPTTGGATGGVFAVPTQHNDNARSGVNPLETVLTQANVKGGFFREISRRPLRGAVFTQPLLIPNAPLPTGEKNLLFVTTMANVVYALDADDPSGPPLWVRVLDDPIELPVAQTPLGASGVWHEVGILGTGTIDGGTLYVVTATKNGDSYRHVLHAMDFVGGGIEKSVTIAAAGFDSRGHAQRAGLTQSNGIIYVAFGGYTLGSDSAGWIFAYDTSLNLLGSLALGNPNGAGITQSGQALAADSQGALFFTTSPGVEFNPSDSPDLGRSLLRLGELSPAGVTTLFSASKTSSESAELGNAGPLLVPNSDLALLSSPSQMYLLRRDADNATSALAQTFVVNRNGNCPAANSCDAAPFAPVLWGGVSNESRGRLYAWLPNDLLKGFTFDPKLGRFACADGDVVCTPFATSALNDSRDAQAHPPERGAALSLSTNLEVPGSGVVWAVHGYASDTHSSDDGIVRAFNADTLSALWNSNSSGVPLGPIAPGATPTVAGGRVYVGTADGLSGRHSFVGNGNGGAPALTNFGDQFLVMAWGLSPAVTRGIELTWSSDGVHFDETALVPAPFLNYEPALAADDASRLYLGWGSNAETAEVVVANDPKFSTYQSMLQRTTSGALEPLALKATSPLALAFGNGHLFMAWYDDTQLHFISSSDRVAFELATLRDFPDLFAYSAPLLSYQEGKLFLASTTTDGVVHLLSSTDDGAHFSAPVTLPMSSNGHPALLWEKLTGSEAISYSWVWSDRVSTYSGPLRISTGRVGEFSIFTGTRPLSALEANPSISAAKFKGSWYVAWSDVAGSLPNVARYSSGELVTYGLASSAP